MHCRKRHSLPLMQASVRRAPSILFFLEDAVNVRFIRLSASTLLHFLSPSVNRVNLTKLQIFLIDEFFALMNFDVQFNNY